MRLSFKSWILAGCIFAVLCTTLTASSILIPSLKNHLVNQTSLELERDLALARDLGSVLWNAGMTADQADGLADRIGEMAGMRVTLITPEGRVVGDSEIDQAGLSGVEDHSTRPEVLQAMDDGQGRSVRHSATLDVDFMYAAAVLGTPQDPQLILRLALPLSEISRNLNRVKQQILMASGVGLLLSLIVSFLVANYLAEPVKKLTQTAQNITSGDLEDRFRRYPRHEIGDLGRAFDHMADHLKDEIEAVTRARNRLEAVLRGMVEAVMVTDAAGRVTMANRALHDMLGLRTNPIGQRPSEILRNADLLEAMSRVTPKTPVINLEIRTLDPNPRTLDVTVTAMPGGGLQAGMVTVFHDVTERKRIEEMRKTFVANVSHELRTPLAAIRGSVETLLDGALNDPKYSRHFTEMIQRQVKRLETIVLDLLDLARLESGAAKPAGEAVNLKNLAHGALNAVAELAASQEVELKLDLPEEPAVMRGDPVRLEQAVVNLLDNAVKYTQPGGWVSLAVRVEKDQVMITVKDNGPGIAPEHHPRLFERFYRVDKDRSRQMGGTGLGLAIVKHVAQVHGGRVELDSFPGRGSSFQLILPMS